VDESFEYLDYPEDYPGDPAVQINKGLIKPSNSIESCESCDQQRLSCDKVKAKSCEQRDQSKTTNSSQFIKEDIGRGRPFSRADFEKLFDDNGRIVDEHALRKAVFMGK